MAMIYNSIPYFPTQVSFFEEVAMELIEARYGMKAETAVMKLVCKIYKENGYYMVWNEEQCTLFTNKVGREIAKEEMQGIVETLMEKGFFDKETYKEHGILTSVEIQRVWLEATKRRKRDLESLPYMLVKTEESDKVSGLTLGADDYIEKPYNPAELIARVKAHLRRYRAWSGGETEKKKDPDQIVNGGLVLDKKQRVIFVEGEEVHLTATEYKILELLMTHPGQVFPAEQIYENVWQETADYTVENTVMVHIRHIREKVEIDAKKPRYVKVVWGIGYKMEKYGKSN